MSGFREWIHKNIVDFNTRIANEEDLKIKALIPYLQSLGYEEADFRFNNAIDVQIGTRKVTVYSDVEILLRGEPQLVIDTKNHHSSISEKDILQSASYAKLVSTPSALFGVTTNGLDLICTDIQTGRRTDRIPTKSQLVRLVDRATRKIFTQVELREVKSALITLLSTDELYRVIHRSKDMIEKKGLIRSDQSFREMTKIILVKMSEERRTGQGKENRFVCEWIDAFSRANRISFIDAFKELFEEAKETYPDIYTSEDDRLRITDSDCVREVVRCLEDFSFLGTGDDIKGAVYEIFLKSTLRGELDQYFTPREIVDFMVQFADPEPSQIILDPACGSGGFLIQAFRHVNQKIVNSLEPEAERARQFEALVNKHLWGHEADYDLHVLAKINLIMHGDGWNNIYQGDTLTSPHLASAFAKLVLTNPPFTIPYPFPDILSRFEMGLGKNSQELDILFVEKSIQCLEDGGELYIVLPEGMLNTRTYLEFRKWLLGKCHMVLTVSLPEGVFIPFGKSVSKTCILGVRKKHEGDSNLNKPEHVFLGRAQMIGYEAGKRDYRPAEPNDLAFFTNNACENFAGIRTSAVGGECGWIQSDLVEAARLDANYLLNIIDRESIKKRFSTLVRLGEVCTIEKKSVRPKAGHKYHYLEVPDITEGTGSLSNIRVVDGADINSDMHEFAGGDLLFVRINPRISRVTLVPDAIDYGLMSKEIYNIKLRPNDYISDLAVLCAIIQSELVRSQAARVASGSSSSRARVHEDDMLAEVFVPVPSDTEQKCIATSLRSSINAYWNASQAFGAAYQAAQSVLGNNCRIAVLRRI